MVSLPRLFYVSIQAIGFPVNETILWDFVAEQKIKINPTKIWKI